jgi:CheY-like chemotaxis protein
VTLIGASEGRTGIALAGEHLPDLVLLDLHLPDIHGAEVLARLKRDQRTRSVPVVVVTADAIRSRTDMLLLSGAYAYLTKPLDVSGLLRTVAEALHAGRRAARVGLTAASPKEQMAGFARVSHPESRPDGRLPQRTNGGLRPRISPGESA